MRSNWMAKLFMLSFDGIDVVVPALLLKEEEDEAFIVIICSRARMAFSRLSKTSDFKCFTKPISSSREQTPFEEEICCLKGQSKASLKASSTLRIVSLASDASFSNRAIRAV